MGSWSVPFPQDASVTVSDGGLGLPSCPLQWVFTVVPSSESKSWRGQEEGLHGNLIPSASFFLQDEVSLLRDGERTLQSEESSLALMRLSLGSDLAFVTRHARTTVQCVLRLLCFLLRTGLVRACARGPTRCATWRGRSDRVWVVR